MENKSGLLSFDRFVTIARFLSIPDFVDFKFVYEVYQIAYEGIEELRDNEVFKGIQTTNSIELLQYCVGEYLYSVAGRNEEELAKVKNDENFIASMAGIVADKYLSLSSFHHPQQSFINKYIPPISSLSTYINFTLSILGQYKKNDPSTTLVIDLLNKSLSIARCTLDLLVDGFETEAFSSWRTLHECECTLILLAKYGEDIINIYNKHLKYSIVFKDGLKDKDKQNEIFANMKEEMKQYNLKSKDIKKYIEYGWIYGVPGVKEDETFKLNFRDGLEKVAGLSAYASRYEMSSEIIHSTPMLIYSNKQYFYYITLLSLYESFFRLEKVFLSFFTKNAGEDQMEKYSSMRKIYYSQLINIHARESQAFKTYQTNQIKKGS